MYTLAMLIAEYVFYKNKSEMKGKKLDFIIMKKM